MTYDKALSSLKPTESTTVYSLQNGKLEKGTVTKKIGFDNGVRKPTRKHYYYQIEMYGRWTTTVTAFRAKALIDNPNSIDWMEPIEGEVG